MADYGRSLISKILIEDDITTAVSAGIAPSWFEDIEHRRVFRFMLDYYAKYQQTPTPDVIESEFPNYSLNKRVSEPYEYYVDKFRAVRERALLVQGIVDANEALEDDDPKKAIAAMNQALLLAGQEVAVLTDDDAIATMRERYMAYGNARKNAGRLTGVATGFPTLDWATGGFQPEQFIVLGGQPKQGKSFLLMLMAIAAQEQGNRVLFLSFEMSTKEQLARYDGITCSLNARKLLHGIFTDEEYLQLKKGMRSRKNMTPFWLASDISATTTVSALAAKIDQHQPDIVFVDGVYLMENEIGADPGSSQAFTSISRSLKRLAQRRQIPVVVTTQALSSKMTKGEVTMHSLGWTSAWSQDADLILGSEQEHKESLINLRLVAGRQVSPRTIGIEVNWKTSLFAESDDNRTEGGEEDED